LVREPVWLRSRFVVKTEPGYPPDPGQEHPGLEAP
jgi:hypothetical protein